MLYETGLGAASLARLVSRSLLEHRFVVATARIIEDALSAEKMVETAQPGLSGLLVQSFAQVRAGPSSGLKFVPISPARGVSPAGSLLEPSALPWAAERSAWSRAGHASEDLPPWPELASASRQMSFGYQFFALDSLIHASSCLERLSASEHPNMLYIYTASGVRQSRCVARSDCY